MASIVKQIEYLYGQLKCLRAEIEECCESGGGAVYDVSRSAPVNTTNNLFNFVLSEDAETKTTLQFVAPTGLETIDEGNGIGWRLIGRDATQYANIGLNAIDFGISDTDKASDGATGENAFNVGRNNTASGHTSLTIGRNNVSTNPFSYSIGYNNTTTEYAGFTFGYGNTNGGSFGSVFGYNNTTTTSAYAAFISGRDNNGAGNYSFTSGRTNTVDNDADFSFTAGSTLTTFGFAAFNAGYLNVVNGNYTASIGRRNDVLGWDAYAIGIELESKSIGTLVVGRANLDYTRDTGLNSLTAPVFIVGNGTLNPSENTANVRSDAFKILLNGTVTAPSLTSALINTEPTGKALLTKEVGVSNETDTYTSYPKVTNTITLNETEFGAIGAKDTGTWYVVLED